MVSSGVSNRHPIYVVKKGDGLDFIARNVFSGLVVFQQIAEANGIKDVNKIGVGQRLWVPLPCSCDEVKGNRVVACSSSIRNDSADGRILAANHTYFLTANNCVQCSCSATTYQLQCRPIQGVLNASCPPVMCPSNNLILGGTLPASGCDVPTCVYEGYNNKNIFTTLSNVSNCLSPGGAPALEGSAATRLMVGWRGMGWMEFLVLFNVVFVSFGLK